jgi:hypothetical protein
MTWLYVPKSIQSNFAPASECSAKDCEPGSPTWAERIAPSATLNGKLTQPQSWQRASKKAAWMLLLSGATCSPSMADASVDAWISSLRVSHARTSASPAARRARWRAKRLVLPRPRHCRRLRMRRTLSGERRRHRYCHRHRCGRSCRRRDYWSILPACRNPSEALTNAFMSRMALYSKEQPPESWENWPTAGGMRNGSLFQRPTLVPLTAASDGFVSHGAAPSAWPTAKGSDGDKGGPNQQGSKGDLMLPSAAANWMTPDAYAPEKGYTRDGGVKGKERPTLAGQSPARHLPGSSRMTPDVPNGGRKLDAETIARKGLKADGTKAQVGLENQTRMWTTPHGMAGIDKNGKAGAGGNFAKQSPAWRPQDAEVSTRSTPRTITGGGETAQRKKELGREDSGGGDLQSQVQTWNLPVSARPTPDASADKYRLSGNSQQSKSLEPTSRAFMNQPGLARPTPAARDSKGANSADHVTTNGTGRMHMDQLPNFVEHHFYSHQDQPTLDGPTSSESSRTSPLRLNPLFVAWLMGWPSTWVDSRAARLKCGGNGVVALQAAVAFVVLARRAGVLM